jgi:hypothetical protein
VLAEGPVGQASVRATRRLFLYIYVNYFRLYKPGLVDNLRAGEFDISPTLLTMMLVSVAIPALMVMFSMTLPVRVNRATNFVFRQDQQISTATNAQSPASGRGHSWVEVRPTARGVRCWPSDQLGSPRARGIRRKYKSSAVPTARSNQAPGLMCPPPASVTVGAPTRSSQGAS